MYFSLFLISSICLVPLFLISFTSFSTSLSNYFYLSVYLSNFYSLSLCRMIPSLSINDLLVFLPTTVWVFIYYQLLFIPSLPPPLSLSLSASSLWLYLLAWMAVEVFLLFVCLFSFMFWTKFCGVMCTILNSGLGRGTGGNIWSSVSNPVLANLLPALIFLHSVQFLFAQSY